MTVLIVIVRIVMIVIVEVLSLIVVIGDASDTHCATFLALVKYYSLTLLGFR